MRGKGVSKRRRALMALKGARADSGVAQARRREREAALEGLTWQEKALRRQQARQAGDTGGEG